jgi:hypothetical protein
MRNGEINGILKPSIPYIEIGYASTPSATIVGWNHLIWSDIYYNTSDFELYSDGDIHIYTTGIYKLEIEVGFKFTDNAANSVIQLRILNNGIEISNTRSIGKVIVAAALTDYIQLSISRTSFLKEGDNISFEFTTTDAQVSIADDVNNSIYYSRARISYIPSGGWNNKSGGSIINRGVRR